MVEGYDLLKRVPLSLTIAPVKPLAKAQLKYPPAPPSTPPATAPIAVPTPG